MRVDFPKAKLFKTNTCFFLAFNYYCYHYEHTYIVKQDVYRNLAYLPFYKHDSICCFSDSDHIYWYYGSCRTKVQNVHNHLCCHH